MKTLSKLKTLPSNVNPKEINKLTPDELLARVQGKFCWVTFEGKTRKGIIEGGIMNPMNHMFIFKAFHIRFVDGKTMTAPANKVTIASE